MAESNPVIAKCRRPLDSACCLVGDFWRRLLGSGLIRLLRVKRRFVYRPEVVPLATLTQEIRSSWHRICYARTRGLHRQAVVLGPALELNSDGSPKWNMRIDKFLLLFV